MTLLSDDTVLTGENRETVRKQLQKVVCFILFIYSRAYNKYLSPTVNLIAVTTLLLTTGLHPCQQRIFKKTNFFMLLVPAFH